MGIFLVIRNAAILNAAVGISIGIFLLIHTAGISRDFILLCIRLCMDVSARCKSLFKSNLKHLQNVVTNESFPMLSSFLLPSLCNFEWDCFRGTDSAQR